jgi:NAD(P)-dependent dehydrogenase (short-subunit alcohol dehydrogenase family)
MSSLSALGHAPGRAAYASAKAAVNAITKALALELAERKIRLNAIMPGYVDTEGARTFGIKRTVAKPDCWPPRLWQSALVIPPIEAPSRYFWPPPRPLG